MWPQIMFLIATAAIIGYCFFKDGQIVTMTKSYAVAHTTIACTLLYFGGFWSEFGIPQVIMMAWYTISLVDYMFAPRPVQVEVAVGYQLAHSAIVAALLWWGGFWSVFGI